MLFVFLGIFYGFIFYIALFGDISEQELEKDKKKFKKITGYNYE